VKGDYMNVLKSYMSASRHSEDVRTLDAPQPAFAALRVETYARFEKAHQSAAAVVGASPLVRWAEQEWNPEPKSSPTPVDPPTIGKDGK
jgi:hypothetical protein